MDIALTPGVLRGKLQAPPSKSAAHRIMIASALGDQAVTVELGELSVDMQVTVDCLKALGATFLRETASGVWQITPLWQSKNREAVLDCGESGSTLRFLLPVAAALGVTSSFTGRGRLPQRPLAPLPELLRQHGCQLTGERLDLTVSGALRGGRYVLPGNVSSQYLTGLMMALPLCSEDSVIQLSSPLASVPYVDMSLEVLEQFGVTVTKKESTEKVHPNEGSKNGLDQYVISGRQKYRSPAALSVEGDWSGAAFYLCAGAVGAPVTVGGLRLDSRQGDRRIVDILRDFGAQVRLGDGCVTVSPGKLRGREVSVEDVPDLFCVLGTVAAAAEGRTLLRDAARLRLKESDRIESTAAMLEGLGVTVRRYEDALEIEGKGVIPGGEVDSAGDHRIAMAGAIAAVASEKTVTIREAQVVEKSFPAFFREFGQLGGKCRVL